MNDIIAIDFVLKLNAHVEAVYSLKKYTFLWSIENDLKKKQGISRSPLSSAMSSSTQCPV